MGAIGVLAEWLVGMVGVSTTGLALWQMFRSHKVKVTNKDTGRSVIINTKAGVKEGRKLVDLMAEVD